MSLRQHHQTLRDRAVVPLGAVDCAKLRRWLGDLCTGQTRDMLGKHPAVTLALDGRRVLILDAMGRAHRVTQRETLALRFQHRVWPKRWKLPTAWVQEDADDEEDQDETESGASES